jgi:hypothetical protein
VISSNPPKIEVPLNPDNRRQWLLSKWLCVDIKCFECLTISALFYSLPIKIVFMFLLWFTITCRRSSLGDFNWATRAFINCRNEHNKALLAPSPKVRFVKAIPAYRRSVTQYWSHVVLPCASWSTWKTKQTHYENEIINVHCDGKVSVMKTKCCKHEHPTKFYIHPTINLEYQNARRINQQWITFSEFLTSCYSTQLTASYTESGNISDL